VAEKAFENRSNYLKTIIWSWMQLYKIVFLNSDHKR
jgi:hypothetical protein